ncbi:MULTISPECIES: hypothetical protein [Photorhabdus]|uniref:Uncharacterized protein n=1 Tax=Photorhabdus luminescens TaxID=29488 RepID=A0A1G5QYL5_PHOLU|nr:hypothetical protein [Photorhabdus luminescens]MCW7763511.1 hypothetical protein [Photorhabdus luminescens subsp. venezuelensis]SCZ66872.1 hypothetical protein SAMN02982990_02619 [Photorhabdus luminescens]
MKKFPIIFIAIFAFGSIGGVFLAGLNMYTRSTTPIESPISQQQETTTAPIQQQ